METQMEKVSYIIGQQIGADFKKQGLDIIPSIFADSVAAAFKGEESKLSPQETQATMEEFQSIMTAKMEESNKSLGEAGIAFLAANKDKDGVTVTPTGLQYKILESGNGSTPAIDATVEVNYEGSLIDGTVFDSSYKRGESISFPVNGVIPGWTEALMLMKEGDTWELTIPSELAYGDRGAGAQIPPQATLIFKVELIKVK